MSTVLVVEDNELNRRLFSDLLGSRGFNVFEVSDGGEVLREVQKNMPDLVLMDIQLPNISGLEVTKQIRALTEIKQPKIVAISAFALKQDATKALQAGCDDYISKPISITSFFETIDRVLKS